MIIESIFEYFRLKVTQINVSGQIFYVSAHMDF